MALLTQTSSYDNISASQYAQNSLSNPIEGVRRMTIRQLLRSTRADDDSDAYILDGHLFKKVFLMANVQEATVHPATGKITYLLDDGTGRIKATRWPLEEGEPTIGHLAYTRILGELETFRGFRSLRIDNIRPMFEADEVFHHFLHAMFDTVVCDKGPPPRGYRPPPPPTPPPPRSRDVEGDELAARLDNVSLSDPAVSTSKASGSSLPASGTSRGIENRHGSQGNGTRQVNGNSQASGSRQATSGSTQTDATRQASQANGSHQTNRSKPATASQIDGTSHSQANGSRQPTESNQPRTSPTSGSKQTNGNSHASGSKRASGSGQASGSKQANGSGTGQPSGSSQPSSSRQASGNNKPSGSGQASGSQQSSVSTQPSRDRGELPPGEVDRYLALSTTARVVLQVIKDLAPQLDRGAGVHIKAILEEIIKQVPDLTAPIFNDALARLVDDGFVENFNHEFFRRI